MTQGTVPVNPEAGEVALEVKAPNGEVLETFVLHFGTNALARLEYLLGERDVLGRVTPIPIEKLMPRLEMPGFTDVRAMLAAGLGDRHKGISLEEAGDLADKVGIKACATAVGIAMKKAFPEVFGAPNEGQGKEGKVPAVPGTGNGSSRTRRKPASVPTSSGAEPPVS